MKKIAFVISTLLMLILGGCSTVVPQTHEYTIFPAVTTDKPRSIPLSSEILRIDTAKTLPSLSSKNMYYLKEGNESGAYLYSHWSDTPATMIERSLASSLEVNRVFDVLLTAPSSARATRILESELNAFYHRFHTDGTSEGYIDITYRLVDARSKDILGIRRFQIALKAPANNAKGGASALSEATRELSLQCTQWLSQLVQEKP